MKLRQRKSIISMIVFVVILGMTVTTDVYRAEAGEAVVEGEKKSKTESNTESEEKENAETKEDSVKETEEKEAEDAAAADDEKSEAADDTGSEEEKPETAVTVPVPIYNYDIVNVVIPTSYSVALNPYELPIKTKDGTVSSAQVVSQNYGIVNKSTRDKVVTATFTIEDENEGKIVFVNSREEALNADKDTYAVYLSAVPADGAGIKVEGADADKDISAEALSNVEMEKAGDHAVTLAEGENQVSFKLSKAVYEFDGSGEIELGSEEGEDKSPELAGLAADNGGVTAFTFDGVMNPKADWSKLAKGIKISVIYAYDNAAGDEKIVDGTGAMVER